MTKLTEITNAMCACKDAACATRVSGELSRYVTDLAKIGVGRPTLTEENQVRAMQIGDRGMRCLEAAMASPASPPTDAQRYVAKNAELEDRLCACKDIACAEAVAAELTKWSEDFLAHPNDSSTMSEEDQERMTTIEREIKACMSKLRGPRR